LKCRQIYSSKGSIIRYFQVFISQQTRSSTRWTHEGKYWKHEKMLYDFQYLCRHNLFVSAGKICVICFVRECTSVSLCVLRSKFMRNRQMIIQKSSHCWPFELFPFNMLLNILLLLLFFLHSHARHVPGNSNQKLELKFHKRV
jgi:hypothetical protein